MSDHEDGPNMDLIELPGWVTSFVIAREGDGWMASVTGDAYGVGSDKTTTAYGPSPREAAERAFNEAEGWMSFSLGRKVEHE